MPKQPEDLQPYLEILNPIVKEIRSAFLDAANADTGIDRLAAAFAKLKEARSLLNAAENIGFLINIGSLQMVIFPLTGDPEKDLGQKGFSLSDPAAE